MKPLEIGETATLENGDVVRCVEDTEGNYRLSCYKCHIQYEMCYKFACLRSERTDGKNAHFELINEK